MTLTRITLSLLALVAWSGVSCVMAAEQQAAPAKRSAATLRPTHAELVQRQRQGPTIKGDQIAPVEPRPSSSEEAETKVSDEVVPPQESRSSDLLSNSTILSHEGCWTIVPKGAVIHIPDVFRERIAAEPVGTLLSWQKFSYQNRGWIYSQPVKFSDATGETPLPPKTKEMHKALARVVVAVFRGGPISVRNQPPASNSKKLAE